jgi:SAM-dependent methyltransferase
MKLNLGCGNDFKYGKDWINIDITEPCNVKADIREGLPFEDQFFNLIWASHILEHLPDLRMIQRELARVMKLWGTLNVIVPYYLSPDAWGDPTHCRAFSEESFQSCYWVGFSVVSLEFKKYSKRRSKTEDTWLHVDMRRNELEYSEVYDALGGNQFVKS